MNVRIGLKGKIYIVLFIIIFILIMSAVVTINRGIYLTKQLLGQQAYKAAELAFSNIDVSKLNDVIELGNSKFSYYYELQDKLRKTKDELRLKYLYIMTRNSKGEYIYVIDGLFPESEEFSKYGDVEINENYYQNFERVMNGDIVSDDFEKTKTWGSLVSAYIPIKDDEGRVIAFLGADVDGSEAFEIINKNNSLTLLFLMLISLVGIISVVTISYRITSPITQLRNYYIKVSNGEAVNPLKLKSKDEIGDLANVLNSRIASVKNILNNIGQGFLTFGSDMIIDSEYSHECLNIFKVDIDSKKFFELVYPGDKEQQRFLESVLEKVLKEKDKGKREIYIPLLSDELIINGRNICIEYKIINGEELNKSDKFMAILTDVTDKRVLEEKMEKEKEILKMVVKIIVNNNDFIECIKEYKSFCSTELDRIILSEQSMQDNVYEIFRGIHTFKGNFSHLDMNHLVKGLNGMEDEISNTKNHLFNMKREELKGFMTKFNMLDWLNKDIHILKQILGEQFISRVLDMESPMLIDKGKLIELEKKMLRSLSNPNSRLLITELRKMRSRSFKELFKVYPGYVEKLAERMNKQVKLVVINGGDFPITSDKYNDFARVLTHIFRNALDHGIESVDERIFRGKEEYGKLLCNIKLMDEYIVISIRDDGRGIDIEKIRRRAIEKGLIGEDRAYSMSKNDLIDLIFVDDFSTKNIETEFSGRGLGLAAVKKEVEKIEGSIEVKSKLGLGTEFVFKLPLYKDIDSLDIPIDKVIISLLQAAGSFISTQIGIYEDIQSNYSISKSNVLKVRQYSAFAYLKGILNGRVVISFDETLARSFTDKFTIGGFSENAEPTLIYDSIAECLNITLGSSLKMFQDLEEFIEFTSPATVKSNYASIQYPNVEVWSGEIDLGAGGLSVSYIPEK